MTAPHTTLTVAQQRTLTRLFRRHDELRGFESAFLVSLARGIRAPTEEQWLAVEAISARILFGVGR